LVDGSIPSRPTIHARYGHSALRGNHVRFTLSTIDFPRREASMRLLTASIAVLLIAGCASQPHDTTATAPAAAPAATATQAPVAAPAGTATQAPVAAPQDGAAAKTAAVKVYPGYKAKQKNGTTMYCKKVAKIGSNFTDEMCLTAADMDALNDRAQEDREAVRRNQTVCGGGGCGGS
jgi:hypothetical protein